MSDILVANAALNDVERLIKYDALLQNTVDLTTERDNLINARDSDVAAMDTSIVRHQLVSLLRLLLRF